MKAVLLVLAFVAVALAGSNTPAASQTFCGKYTTAVFGVNNATNQETLIGIVVDRTVGGCTTAQGCLNNVIGVANKPLNQKFFNGSFNGVDYRVPANYAPLRLALVKFFSLALGCTFYLATIPSYVPASMYAVHKNMGITDAIWGEFIGELLLAVSASGVTLGSSSDANSEVAYLGALVGAMGSVPATITCTDTEVNCFFSICSNSAACFAATDYDQLISGTDANGANAWAFTLPAASASQDIGTSVNGNVNWRYGTAHNVIQTDTLGGSTLTTGGFTSGALGLGGTYTKKFLTAGTYFYRCQAHATMLGTITVAGSGAAGLTASVTVLAAAILAALALKQ